MYKTLSVVVIQLDMCLYAGMDWLKEESGPADMLIIMNEHI